MQKNLNVFCGYITLGALLFLPLVFTSLTANYFVTPKLLLFAFSLGLTFLGLGLPLISKKFHYTTTPLTIPALAITISLLLNLIVHKEARYEAFVGRGVYYLFMAALFLTVPTLLGNRERVRAWVTTCFLALTSFLSLHTILQLTVLAKWTALPTYMQSQFFTPTGAILTTLALLTIGAGTTFRMSQKEPSRRPLYLILAGLHVVAAVALGALIFAGNTTKIDALPWSASWSLALDALKNGRNLLLGVGLGNYGALYSAAKPLFLNQTAYWNIMVQNGNPELLHLLATTGLLGTGSILLALFVSATEIVSRREFSPLQIANVLLALALLFLPFSGSLLALFIVLTLVNVSQTDHDFAVNFPAQITLGVALLGLIALLGLSGYRLARGERAMRRAQLALTQNDGKKVYDEHILAVNALPWSSEYRLSYAQINLTLASTLSSKSDISESDRTTITQLVSQAIREGKTAVSLRPSDSRSWQYLGLTYRNLINVAQGADQFALEAYAQAVTLDPGNPALRFDFASLLAQLAQSEKDETKQTAYYTRSVSEYQTAIQLKADYANAYYNLSKVLELTKNYERAAAMLDKTISLLPDGNDKQTAVAELETLKAKLPKPSASPTASPEATKAGATTDLSEPSPLPSPLSGGPVDLPKDN